MFCGVTIRYLALSMILYNQQLLVTCDNSQKVINIMNMLLKFPGWGQIDGVAAKHKNGSFTGLDLFLTYSDDSNVNETYRKTTHLLACAYANNLIHFITTLQSIALQINREGYKMKDRLARQRRYRRKRKTMKKVNNPDYTLQWELFNLAVGENRKSVYMFSYMMDAMGFLLNLVPLGDLYYSLNPVLHTVHSLQNLAFNAKHILPEYKMGYINEDDNAVVVLNRKLYEFLNSLVIYSVGPFTNDFCMLSDNLKVNLPKRGTSYDYDITAAVLKIKSLVNEVVSNYHEYGFSCVRQIEMKLNEPNMERMIVPDKETGIEPGLEPDMN